MDDGIYLSRESKNQILSPISGNSSNRGEVKAHSNITIDFKNSIIRLFPFDNFMVYLIVKTWTFVNSTMLSPNSAKIQH